MKCRCGSIKHDKALGCIVDHDGHFGDFCDMCILLCDASLQVKKFPHKKMKIKECNHPENSRRLEPIVNRLARKVFWEDDDDDNIWDNIVVGHKEFCNRCKKEVPV